MSSWRNFIQDFPDRCEEVWRLAHGQAAKREVTLMLMVAATGLAVPYERLRKHHHRNGTEVLHPSGDRDRFHHAQAAFDQLMASRFRRSLLYRETDQSWMTGRITTLLPQPELWFAGGNLREQSNWQVDRVLSTIRNGLAHASVYAQPAQGEIRELIFVGSLTPCHPFVKVSLAGFRRFMDNWFSFLRDLDLGRACGAEE